MSTPRNLSDIVRPAIMVESEAAAFLLGLDLASQADKETTRTQLALTLMESAARLHKLSQLGLGVE